MSLVRPAVVADATAITDAHLTGWQHAYRGLLPDKLLDGLDRQRRTDSWKDLLGGDDPNTLVAEVDGEVVGFSNYGPARHDTVEWGELYAIYVHPVHWGGGHGRQLIEAVESALVALGYGKAHLWVLDGNRGARDFYERQGWVLNQAAELRDDIGGTTVTEVRYDRALKED